MSSNSSQWHIHSIDYSGCAPLRCLHTESTGHNMGDISSEAEQLIGPACHFTDYVLSLPESESWSSSSSVSLQLELSSEESTK